MSLDLYSAVIFGYSVAGPDLQHQAAGGGAPSLAQIGEEIDLRVELAYESEPSYAGLCLAVSDHRLAERLGVPQIPRYFAVPVDGLAALLKPHLPDETVERARRDWERLRAHARARHGRELPEGALLYVHDYG